MNTLGRSLMTISCRDSDAIPKVDGAGKVFMDGCERIQLMHDRTRAGGDAGISEARPPRPMDWRATSRTEH